MKKIYLLIMCLFISVLSFAYQPAGLIEDEKSYQIEKVYPNPAETYAYIELQSDIYSDATITLIDILGSTVQRWNDVQVVPGNQKIRLTFQNHNSGIYLIRVEIDNHAEVVRIRIL